MSSFSEINYTSNFYPTSYYSGQGFPYNSFSNDDTCFSLCHPPSPLVVSFEDELLLFPYLRNLETQPQSLTTIEDKIPVMAQEKKNNSKTDKSRKIPAKKSSKKDRHSKIVTSGGARDRRMRLSLEVATKFFSLHEMLGFHKASKTLEWLLNKSQWAIIELSIDNCGGQGDGGGGAGVDANSISSTAFECEAVSSGVFPRKNDKSLLSCPNRVKKKKAKVARVYRTIDKTSREKARQRARERTSAKNKLHG